jgi:hypothetical protein
MQVGVVMEFKADRREPLGDMIRRVAGTFEQAGLSPMVDARFMDGLTMRNVSAIDRALKKYPHLASFVRTETPRPDGPVVRCLTTVEESQPLPLADVLALADGVPRSLPFHNVTVTVRPLDPASEDASRSEPVLTITIGDSWWVNGRSRSLHGRYTVEAEPNSKNLPAPPPAVGAVIAAFGKARNTRQLLLTQSEAANANHRPRLVVAKDQNAKVLVAPIVEKYQAELRAIIERIRLPHDLPPEREAETGSGPLKPTLVQLFGPRGFDCHGGSGLFTLQHRTADNHIVEILLDVGSWSRSVSTDFRVRGPGFDATLKNIPVAVRAERNQYPIGSVEDWERIVANLGAIADELRRTFVEEIEAAVGPAPAWFDPGRSF